MKLIIEIDEDDYTMCQILANEMCDTRMKLTDNLKYAISNGIPLDKIREEIEQASYEHYFEYGEYIGENTRKKRIINTNKQIKQKVRDKNE